MTNILRSSHASPNLSSGVLVLMLLTAPPALQAHAVVAGGDRVLLDNLRAFAQDRPRACPAATPATPLPPPGWRAEQPRCAWRGLLHVQRWHAPARAVASCTGAPASYWAWMRTRFGAPMRAQSLAWDMAWTSNAVRSAAADVQRVSVITRNADGSWSATEWRWTPSPRLATRQWQQGRWQLLQQAAARLQPPPAAAMPQETAMVLSAWQATLQGRPAEIDGAIWRWQGNGICLGIDMVGLSDAQVQMPYQQSEGRLEQRAAMQLLMARRYPGAEWLAPFALLPRPANGQGGAKYSALWRQDQQVRGQLWIPRAGDESIVRVRMSGALPAALPEPRRTPQIQLAARAIQAEMAALAAAWDGLHER